MVQVLEITSFTKSQKKAKSSTFYQALLYLTFARVDRDKQNAASFVGSWVANKVTVKTIHASRIAIYRYIIVYKSIQRVETHAKRRVAQWLQTSKLLISKNTTTPCKFAFQSQTTPLKFFALQLKHPKESIIHAFQV